MRTRPNAYRQSSDALQLTQQAAQLSAEHVNVTRKNVVASRHELAHIVSYQYGVGDRPNLSRRTEHDYSSGHAVPVLVTDFQMPFASMVGFMVKWAIAAIPAVVILFAIFAILGALLGGFFASIFQS